MGAIHKRILTGPTKIRGEERRYLIMLVALIVIVIGGAALDVV